MEASGTPIAIDNLCDARLAAGVERLLDAVQKRTRTEARRLPQRSVKLLALEHVAPVFEAVASDLANGDCAPSQACLRAAIAEPRRLHLLMRALARQLRAAGVADEVSNALVETMRSVGHFVSDWPDTKRVVPESERGHKGASRRLRHVEARTNLHDWPYCELCWRLSQSAEHLEQHADRFEESFSRELSERFCADHARVSGTLYRRDQKNRGRFQELVRAIYEEISSDAAYRALFDLPGRDADWVWSSSDPSEEMLHLALRNALPISPLQMSVRKIAYKIAMFRPRQIARAIEIGELQREALESTGRKLTQREIAARLGVTKQEVSRRMKIGGCVDFNRSSPLLRWWPFDDRDGAKIIRVSSGREVARAATN